MCDRRDSLERKELVAQFGAGASFCRLRRRCAQLRGQSLQEHSAELTSPRVHSYELTKELPDDVVDDVLPTRHQRDVSEGDRPVGEGMTKSQSIDDGSCG
jgi:hypothetical protein